MPSTMRRSNILQRKLDSGWNTNSQTHQNQLNSVLPHPGSPVTARVTHWCDSFLVTGNVKLRTEIASTTKEPHCLDSLVCSIWAIISVDFNGPVKAVVTTLNS